MPTITLNGSDGTTATLKYRPPTCVDFAVCIGDGQIGTAHVDVGAETIDVGGVRYGVHARTPAEAALLEQAGSVCEVFERALDVLPAMMVTMPPRPGTQDAEDAALLTRIADLANAEADHYARFQAVPSPHLRMVPWDRCPLAPDDPMQPSTLALRHFIEETLVERAQKAATAEAKRRQAAWEAEQREVAREMAAEPPRELVR